MYFSTEKQVFFYLSLIFYKLTSWMECYNYKTKVFTNELKFLLSMVHMRKLDAASTSTITLHTRFGFFHIRDMDIDITIASPSFERLDIDFFNKLILRSIQNGKRIVYIDVGAGFGNQIIILSTLLHQHKEKAEFFAFEPDVESVMLLKKNMKLNNIKHIHIQSVALSNKKEKKLFYFLDSMQQVVSFPTSHKIILQTDTLNNYIKDMHIDNQTDIYIKMDIEGHEIEALKGAAKLTNYTKNIFLMVEDSISFRSKELFEYLEKNADFIVKKTAYNSFWKLHW